MRDSKSKNSPDVCNVNGCTQDKAVKITKGALKDCQGKISARTNEGFYFIRIDKCQRESDRIYRPIDLFLPDEFEIQE